MENSIKLGARLCVVADSSADSSWFQFVSRSLSRTPTSPAVRRSPQPIRPAVAAFIERRGMSMSGSRRAARIAILTVSAISTSRWRLPTVYQAESTPANNPRCAGLSAHPHPLRSIIKLSSRLQGQMPGRGKGVGELRYRRLLQVSTPLSCFPIH